MKVTVTCDGSLVPRPVRAIRVTRGGLEAKEGLCLTACARAEVGWGKESGCGIGVVNVTDAKRKRQPKEKQSFS